MADIGKLNSPIFVFDIKTADKAIQRWMNVLLESRPDLAETIVLLGSGISMFLHDDDFVRSEKLIAGTSAPVPPSDIAEPWYALFNTPSEPATSTGNQD